MTIQKPHRPDAEIDALAVRLRSGREEGESLDAWWRRNVRLLTEHVRRGWRWVDVGAAMTRAGVAYGTGRPWTENVLRVKASQARRQLRGRRTPRPQEAAQGDLYTSPEPARQTGQSHTRAALARRVTTPERASLPPEPEPDEPRPARKRSWHSTPR